MLDWCVGSLYGGCERLLVRPLIEWGAVVGLDGMLVCFLMTAITLRMWPAAWTTYGLPSGARESLSLVLGVVDVGWCRSFFANVVSTSLQIKNGSPCWTWLYAFSGDVGLLMSVFYSSDFRNSGKKEKCRKPGGTRPHFEIHVNVGCKPHNCVPLLVMHFKIYIIMMSVQLDLKFLQIVNYVICHPN